MEPKWEFQVGMDSLFDKRDILLWNSVIRQVKVQWKHLSMEEATWELESNMQVAYLGLFQEADMDE